MANPDWASLPLDLLLLILKNLPSPSDFISFHGVCKWWRSAACQPDENSPSLPLLVDHDVFPDTCRLHFYSPFSTESRTIRILQMGTKWVAGLSQGYLIAFDKLDFSVSLFNPFTRHSISLPPLTIEPFKLKSFRPYLLNNREMVVISHLDQSVLKLGRCKVGDQEWSFVSCKVGANGGGNVYYKGMYYVNESAEGPTMVIDPATSDVLFTILPPEKRIPHLNSWKISEGFDCLVESPMGLLRIFRQYNVFESLKNFDIHQLVNKDGSFRWVKMGSIANLMVFLDKFNGICASTNGVHGMRGNCIYFTKFRLDDIYGWRGILCRYDIASGDIDTVALPHCLETRGSWFVPSLATIPD